ncbi:hypothetical protein SAMN05216464_11396 [Mucilaginibacter pineti]|uniref:Uncharacterized protein n=1 Tax=Mucilaginibacter pineti TaxID=1391627 RepID=A0A1G7IN42_9SPHI|nr:hypothetical protein [Mucilaginibacter pineti]SDF14157.1 hypothetical protein SAMN05216464_11396 [Mucilaginibacter pineti]
MRQYLFTVLLLANLSMTASGQALPAFKAYGNKIQGLTADREVKMREALATFEKIMNDPAFQAELLKKSFAYDIPDDPNSSLTTRQVAEKLYRGSEWYQPADDNTANIYWEIKKRAKIVTVFTRHPAIGYGLPSDTTIYTYTWWFDDSRHKADLVGHIAHEWSHKLKFDHLTAPHAGRELTVPYAFGDLVTLFALKYYSRIN